MLKKIILSTSAKPAYTMINENKPNMDSSNEISGDKIDNRIENLSSIIKLRNSSRTDFLFSKPKKPLLPIKSFY